MATAFVRSVSAIQVGSYFVRQYYQVLQQQPDFVHQFYTDLSTMMHIDGSATETASGMLQIHTLIMSLKFTGIEIKTAHSLESWSGGVLVMVSGLVQTKEFSSRRGFVQTFFLAPQEKGYFVLNDILHLQDEEQQHSHQAAMLEQQHSHQAAMLEQQHSHQAAMLEQQHSHQATMLAHSSFELNASTPHPEPAVADSTHGRETQENDSAVPIHPEESETVDKYSIPEPQQHISEVDDRGEEEIPVDEPVVSLVSTSNLRDQPPPVEEPIREAPKHTYASILRVAKGQSGHVAPQPTVTKNTPAQSEWHQAQQAVPQQSYSGPERSIVEVEDAVTLEDEGEVKSVYVRNLPSSATASDLEQEFKNFGRIKRDGVLIKSRKDAGVYYAFVEFEDILGVQNALKASPILLGGRQIYVEERRPGSLAARGRRGRGRGGYQPEAPRGRFGGGRAFGRGGAQDSGERGDYSSRLRGNGYHQRGPRQERGILGSQVSRNGQSLSDAAA